MSVQHFDPESGALLPLPEKYDYFALLGQAPRLQLDPAEMEKVYYQLSRRLHPDFFQQAAPEVQQATLDRSALVNRAYRQLKTLEGRVEYLLHFYRGEQSHEEKQQAPQSLLMTVFELQEAIEEYGALGADADEQAREQGRARLNELRGELEAMAGQHQTQLEKLAEEWDATLAGEALPSAEAAKDWLDRLTALRYEQSYLRRLFANIDQALGDDA